VAAQIDRRNAETLTLRFTVRMTNGDPAAAQAVVLLVRQADESTEIAVDLSGKPRG
jgi:hypothetical protein